MSAAKKSRKSGMPYLSMASRSTPHAEGKALIDLRVDADIAQDIGVHHAAAQNLHPVLALADAQFFADALIADIHFRAGFREREEMGAEARAHLIDFKEGFDEFLEAPFQMAHMGFGVDHQALRPDET